MPTYRPLGQVAPSAATATPLYTVGAVTNAVISTIMVCNQSATPTTYRIAIQPANETLAAKHYIAYDVTLGANQATAYTLGITLAATDVITVYAAAATVSFSAFGAETV
jgi:hypothetical protein